jgi:hypothetical protein
MDSGVSGAKTVPFAATISRKALLWMGLFSVIVTVGCVSADIILEYDPQGNYSLTTPAPVTIELWRVFVGGFLGVFCIPLEVVGYWVVCTILAKAAPRLFRVLFWVIAYGIVVGTVFHGSSVALILLEQAIYTATGATQTVLLHLQNILLIFGISLGIFFEVCYFAIWVIIAVTVLRYRTLYPKWFVLFIPALGSLIITAIGQSHAFPVLGNILYPAVLSLPHLCFFALSTFYLARKTIT